MARKGNPITAHVFLMIFVMVIPILIGIFWLLLAGAAWSFDFPFFLSSALFSVFYYSLLYICIYMDMKCSVYARTIYFFHSFLVKEKESIHFFHKITFILSCFFFFILNFNYFIDFDEYDVDDLINPLQVVAQLSCFFFYFKFERSDVKERHLTLLCFLFSIICTIYLKGIHFGLLFYKISLLYFVIYILNLDYVPLVVLLFYSLDVGLAKWGFFLLFQQVAYYALSISLDKEQCIPQNRVVYTKIFLLFIQFFIGLFFYQEFYLKELINLAALLSGGCIIFICIKKRGLLAFLCAFCIYFFISICIGLVSSLDKGTALDFRGLFIFIFLHLILLLGLKLFIFPHENQAVVPFLFYTLFYIQPFFPHLQWMEKWIEGFDLLLFFLSFFSVIEESRASQKKRERIKKREKRSRKNFKKRHKYSTGIRDPPG